MGLVSFWLDTTTQRKRAVAYPGFVDFHETVVTSAKATFLLAVDIDAAHAIDAYVDGRIQEEGVAWNRDSSANSVVFTTPIDVGRWVKVRVISK